MEWPLTEKTMIDHWIIGFLGTLFSDKPISSVQIKLVFQELASLLPEDWADYHDPAHVNDYNNLKDFE